MTAVIAEHAGCWIARASRILAGWHQEGWTAKRGPTRGRGAHRVLEHPDAMLGPWTAHVNATPVERWFAHTTSHDLDDVQPLDSRVLSLVMASAAIFWVAARGASALAPGSDRTLDYTPDVSMSRVTEAGMDEGALERAAQGGGRDGF
jgi:hypothetical protein